MINTAAKLSEQALMKSSNSDSIKRCVVLFKFCIPDHGNSETFPVGFSICPRSIYIKITSSCLSYVLGLHGENIQ